MRRRIFLGLALTALATVSHAAEPASAAKATVLTRAQLDTLLAKPESVLLIDVRRPDEIQTLGGFAVYLNVQAADLEQRLAFIPRERTLVTVSNHAARASKAAELLASRGFKVAGAIGVQSYEEEGGTLVRVAKPDPAKP